MNKKKVVLFLYLMIMINTIINANSPKKIIIGIYDDPPAIYLENSFPNGYFFDIFDGFFKDNGYTPEYKYGSWDEIVTWLKVGKVDAVFDIASTEERKDDFDFNNETIFLSWGVIYGRKDITVSSFYDLENLKISVVKGDVYYEGHKDSLKEVLEALKVKAIYKETGNYNESVKQVINGEADVCVLPREYADFVLRNNDSFIQTPIIFKPISVNIAFTKNSEISKELIPKIDENIKKEKQNKDSNYYKSINKYTNGSVIIKEKIVVKKEIDYKTLLIEFFALFLIFVLIYSIILKRKIRIMTKDLIEMNKELKEISIKDHLTNIYNRRHFEDILEKLFRTAKDNRKELSFIILDIDYFKKVNDFFGHQVGDEVLKSVAKLIQNNVNSQDILCRYGGEEFAICLPDTNLEKAWIFAEKIRAIIEQEKFNSLKTTITITCGVSTFSEIDNDTNSLIARADEALYFGKNSGRNCTVIHSNGSILKI